MYAIATTSTSTSTLTTSTSTSTSTSTLTGRGLIPADLCQYADVIRAGDLLRVDFDTITVRKAGLYLVEAINSEGVAWMGCRRFDRNINGVMSIDQSGRGDWRDLPSLSGAGLRVAGYVEAVLRAC
jgi:hypothetical protein